MLKIRIIPVLLTDGVMCIRPRCFEKPGRIVGPMMQYVRNFNKRNIDELIILNIRARDHGFKIQDYEERIKEMCGELYCPVTLGGNVTSLEDIELLLRCGADKVSINTAAQDYSFIEEAAKKFGSQCIVASIDVKKSYWRHPTSKSGLDKIIYRVYTNNGKIQINPSALEHSKCLEESGVGEILLTSIDRDGTRTGYDKGLIDQITKHVKIPVIANGGCSGFGDMADALRNGAHAVAASSMFLFTPLTPANCGLYLANHGFQTRVEIK